MKSKLSAMKFVRNNKKQVWVIIIALSLTLMTMYVINFLLLATTESFQPLFIEQPKKVAAVDLTLEAMQVDTTDFETDEELEEYVQKTRDAIMEKLKAHEGIRDVYYTQCLYALYQGIVGGVGANFPLLEAEQIPAYLEHMGAKLAEGDMPADSGEILVDKKVMENRNLKIGDYFEESTYGKVFRVVGAVESDCLVCVGTPQGYTNSGWYMIILCDENHSDMTKVLSDIGIEVTENDTIFDAVEWGKMYKELVTDEIDAATFGILLVVMVFLAISVIVTYISFMRSRVNEYCLYASIGYSRKDIYKMMMRELGLIFGISILLGIVLTSVILLLLGNLVLDHLGLVYRYLYPEQLFRIIAAFLAVIAILQIPILGTINSIKTIDLMEE